MNYAGPPMTFQMKPELLVKISKEFAKCDCYVCDNRLLIDGKKWRYFVRLTVPE